MLFFQMHRLLCRVFIGRFTLLASGMVCQLRSSKEQGPGRDQMCKKLVGGHACLDLEEGAAGGRGSLGLRCRPGTCERKGGRKEGWGGTSDLGTVPSQGNVEGGP